MTDKAKLRSAIAYLAEKLPLGKVKLFKLLYLADFTALSELGHSISTDTYENFEMGPVPVTLWRDFDSITDECVTIDLVDTGVIPEQQMRAKDGFVHVLTPEEAAILDRVIDEFGRWSGNALRDYTHRTIPYRATQRGQTIPYGMAAYLRFKKPSRADLDALLEDDGLRADLRDALAHRSDKPYDVTAPAGFKWEDAAFAFLDQLVDRDILYLDVELTVEALIHAGLHDEVTMTFDLDGRTIHWHRMPPLHPGLKPLDIFTTIEQSGLIRVIHICFADDRGQR